MSDKIFSIERPSLNLLKNYFIQSLLTGPGFLLLFPIMLCRYYTLRYQFDNEGIKMSWGLLFKKEIKTGEKNERCKCKLMKIAQRYAMKRGIQEICCTDYQSTVFTKMFTANKKKGNGRNCEKKALDDKQQLRRGGKIVKRGNDEKDWRIMNPKII